MRKRSEFTRALELLCRLQSHRGSSKPVDDVDDLAARLVTASIPQRFVWTPTTPWTALSRGSCFNPRRVHLELSRGCHPRCSGPGFNPTRVRLEHLTVGSQRLRGLCFNLTGVRLKPRASVAPLCGSCCFKPTRVRLKRRLLMCVDAVTPVASIPQGSVWNLPRIAPESTRLRRFNPTKVRLDRAVRSLNDRAHEKLQSHKVRLKRTRYTGRRQSPCGSIPQKVRLELYPRPRRDRTPGRFNPKRFVWTRWRGPRA